MKWLSFLVGIALSVGTSGPANAVSIDILGTDNISFSVVNSGLGVGTVSVTGGGGSVNLTPGVSFPVFLYSISAVNLPDPLIPFIPPSGQETETVSRTLAFSVGGLSQSVTFNFIADYTYNCFNLTCSSNFVTYNLHVLPTTPATLSFDLPIGTVDLQVFANDALLQQSNNLWSGDGDIVGRATLHAVPLNPMPLPITILLLAACFVVLRLRKAATHIQ